MNERKKDEKVETKKERMKERKKPIMVQQYTLYVWSSRPLIFSRALISKHMQTKSRQSQNEFIQRRFDLAHHNDCMLDSLIAQAVSQSSHALLPLVQNLVTNLSLAPSISLIAVDPVRAIYTRRLKLGISLIKRQKNQNTVDMQGKLSIH